METESPSEGNRPGVLQNEKGLGVPQKELGLGVPQKELRVGVLNKELGLGVLNKELGLKSSKEGIKAKKFFRITEGCGGLQKERGWRSLEGPCLVLTQ